MNTRRTHTIGGCWGNHIRWLKFDDRKVWGHMPSIPAKGDYVESLMASGRVVRFKIKKVERPGNPRDMFFADVEDVGYVLEDGSISTNRMAKLPWWKRAGKRIATTVQTG